MPQRLAMSMPQARKLDHFFGRMTSERGAGELVAAAADLALDVGLPDW